MQDSRQESFHIGGHKRKEARGGEGDGTGGARLEIKSLKHLRQDLVTRSTSVTAVRVQ